MRQETRCFDALAELYGMLNEEDVLAGLWKRRGTADETRAALSCLQHGLTQAGQDWLLEAMRKASVGAFPAPTQGAEHPSVLALPAFWLLSPVDPEGSTVMPCLFHCDPAPECMRHDRLPVPSVVLVMECCLPCPLESMADRQGSVLEGI